MDKLPVSASSARSLSAEYYKRRLQLLRARAALVTLTVASMALLLTVSLAEGWAVRFVLSSAVTRQEFAGTLGVTALVLALFCIVLARLALHISYHIEHAGIAKTIVSTAFVLVYVFVLTKLPNPQPVLFLAVSKLFAIFLFFRFWHSQLSEARLQMRMKLPPRIFLVSIHAFFVCRWVLVACWLLLALGFATALVSVHPIIDMEGWEGLSILGTFYLMFRAFVRNPNAHADY